MFKLRKYHKRVVDDLCVVGFNNGFNRYLIYISPEVIYRDTKEDWSVLNYYLSKEVRDSKGRITYKIVEEFISWEKLVEYVTNIKEELI